MSLSQHALTTVDAVKEYLKIAINDTDYDKTIERQINAISEAIENYCIRHFEKAEYTEKYSGNDKDYLRLNQYPVNLITYIKVLDTEIDSTLYDYLNDSGILYNQDIWPSGKRNIEVNYDAGYVLPKDEDGEISRTLPYDLEDACIEMVAAKFNQRQEEAAGKLSRTQEEYNVRYEKDIPAHIRQVLDRYRKVIA
ncbi:MAG: hypothetical protein ABFD18_06265 [Syntrophomonas sp.]